MNVRTEVPRWGQLGGQIITGARKWPPSRGGTAAIRPQVLTFNHRADIWPPSRAWLSAGAVARPSRAGAAPGSRGSSRRPAGSSARRGRARSANAPRTARTGRRSTRPRRSESASGTVRSSPPPMTSRGTAMMARVSTGTPASIWRRACPDSCGFWPIRCWMRSTSSIVRSRSSRWSRSGSVSQPTSERPYASGMSRSSCGRTGSRRSRGGSGLIRIDGGDRHAFGGLQHEQATQAVADRHGVRSEAVHRRDDVLGVGLERELARIRGRRPVVVAQVERVALPAAAREVAEVALPDPRATELAVDQQQRFPPRSTLGQPRLDVQPTIVELDLVLAHRPPVRGGAAAAEDRLGWAGIGHSVTIRGG